MIVTHTTIKNRIHPVTQGNLKYGWRKVAVVVVGRKIKKIDKHIQTNNCKKVKNGYLKLS